MTLRTGLAVNSISIDAPDVRLGQAGLVIRDTSNVPRSGIFPAHTNAIVSSRTDLRVDVAAFSAAFSRSATYGAVLFGNDGTVQSPVLSAPTANSWIYHLYVAVPDSTAGDAAAVPSLQVARGAAAASPATPAVPAGGLSLATILVPSTATTTQSSGVVITPTFQYTTVVGGTIFFRTEAQLLAASGFLPGTHGYAIDTRSRFNFYGTAWGLSDAVVQFVGGTPLVGSVPSKPRWRRYSGQVLVSTNADGLFFIDIPTGVFPNAVLPPMFHRWDFSNYGPTIQMGVAQAQAGSSLTRVYGSLWNLSNARLPNLANVPMSFDILGC